MRALAVLLLVAAKPVDLAVQLEQPGADASAHELYTYWEQAAFAKHLSATDRTAYLVRAGDLGHVLAADRLGHLYHVGEGGLAADTDAAIRYYRVAADAGHLHAQLWLGTLLVKVDEVAPEGIQLWAKCARAAAASEDPLDKQTGGRCITRMFQLARMDRERQLGNKEMTLPAGEFAARVGDFFNLVAEVGALDHGSTDVATAVADGLESGTFLGVEVASNKAKAADLRSRIAEVKKKEPAPGPKGGKGKGKGKGAKGKGKGKGKGGKKRKEEI